VHSERTAPDHPRRTRADPGLQLLGGLPARRRKASRLRCFLSPRLAALPLISDCGKMRCGVITGNT